MERTMSPHVLLVIPNFRDKYYLFPIGIASINASLRKHGVRVLGMNLSEIALTTSENPLAVLETTIQNNNIDIVMCGGLTNDLYYIKEVFDTAKSVRHNIITIGGGGGFSSEPIIFSELTHVDFAITGEGEYRACTLLDAIAHNSDYTHIAGLVYKGAFGDYIFTGNSKAIESLDDLPFPSYDDLGLKTYLERNAAISILLARSCPFKCRFCFHPTGNTYRQKSLDIFFQELDTLIRKYTFSVIHIVDELFCCSKQKIRDFCERVAPYNLTWTCAMRVDVVDETILRLMKKAGCREITYGYESHCQRILDNMNKKITCAQIDLAAKITYDVGIAVFANFIFGDELENWESAMETLRWWYAHRHYGINFCFIVVYPGTPYYYTSLERGIIKNKKQYIQSGCPLINMSQLSLEEMVQLQSVAQYVNHSPEGATNMGRVLSYKLIDTNYKMSLSCVHCKYQFNALQNKDFVDRSIMRICCPHCGRRVQFVINENYQRLDGNASFEDFLTTAVEYRTKCVLDAMIWLQENNIHTIGIYGLGERGEQILKTIEDMQQSAFEVVFLTDQNEEKLSLFSDRYKTISPQNIDAHKIDALLVTPLTHIVQIKNVIDASGYKGKIVFLNDFTSKHCDAQQLLFTKMAIGV